ncbi:MAG: geranylgeranylglycerol-phosphate geranylgeranyltransferase [Bacteroidales bacterium]|nr:geranylgeranylglycerol-phosphate geranylgeranyltransferase [Bacteroidales bacterium]
MRFVLIGLACSKIKHTNINRIIAISKLVRLPNLMIIALTQYAMRYLVMQPLLPSQQFELQFGNLQFGLLVFATMLIAAGGYIINDYFDTQTDWVNKPGDVVVGFKISRRQAIILHSIVNLIGIGIGIYLSFYVHIPSLSLVFILATGLLWFYSTNYKRQFLIGNLIVSFLTALVPLMVVLFEIPLLNRTYGEIMVGYSASFNYMFAWIAGFSFFAFFTTLIREIIKDMEDFEGDRAFGMKTLPIVLGKGATKIILSVLILFTIASLAFLLIKYLMFSGAKTDYLSALYFLAFLIGPLVFLLIMNLFSKNRKDFHRASMTIKLVMLFGILYSVVVFYILNFREV